jgi:hypothetical protein
MEENAEKLDAYQIIQPHPHRAAQPSHPLCG